MSVGLDKSQENLGRRRLRNRKGIIEREFYGRTTVLEYDRPAAVWITTSTEFPWPQLELSTGRKIMAFVVDAPAISVWLTRLA